MILRLLIACALVGALWSCGGTADRTPVPLPVAYPRLPVAVSDSMITVAGTPIPVHINPAARAVIAQNALTLTYPAAKTDIFFTFIPYTDSEERARILDARRERISLNLNGIPAVTTHPADEVAVVVAESGTQTPVQLLADLDGYVVTATAFVHDPRATQAYDSIAPLIDVLRHDLEKALTR